MMDKSNKIYLRINQLGYYPKEAKTAILFSHAPVRGRVLLVPADQGKAVIAIRHRRI